MYKLPKKENTAQVSARFDHAFEAERQRLLADDTVEDKTVDFGRVLYNVFKTDFWYGGMLKFFNDVCGMSIPIYLNLILLFLEDTNGTEYDDSYGWLLACLLFTTSQLKSLIENAFFFQMTRIAVQMNAAVAGAVYNKSLRLSSSARNESTTGEIVNLMQLDAQRLSMLMYQLHMLWSGLFQIAGYLTQLGIFIGWSAAAGVLSMPMFIFVQAKFMTILQRLRREQVAATDERVKQTNEVIQGIRAVKMYAWEECFTRRITDVRSDRELPILTSAAIYRAANMALISASPTLILVITFFFYTVVAGEAMDAATVFTVVAVFDRLRFPLILYPSVIAQYVEARVSVKRLSQFLARDEVDRAQSTGSDDDDDDGDDGKADDQEEKKQQDNHDVGGGGDMVEPELDTGAIAVAIDDADDPANKNGAAAAKQPSRAKDAVVEIKNATFGWSGDQAVLEDISLTVPRGSLTAVIGPVGSGKSSLCLAILNEMKRLKGTSRVRGSIAYAAQNAWILNMSLRENVRFSLPWDKKRYRETLRVCSLRHDIKMLPDGDMTEIGERGINLSGGQKQRVAIARAVYSDADLFVFDDPLSALDAEVSREVFERCIAGKLGDKTRVMVTNQLHFLQHVDQVVVMDTKIVDGKPVGYIKEIGTFEDLMSHGLDFAALMAKHDGDEGEKQDKQHLTETELAEASHREAEAQAADAEKDAERRREAEARAEAEMRKSGAETDGPSRTVGGSTTFKTQPHTDAGRLMTTEERNVGAVPLEVYVKFAAASKNGVWLAIGTVLMMAIAQLSGVFGSIWMSVWSEESDKAGSASPDPGLGFYMGIYAAASIMYAVFNFLRTLMTTILGLRSATAMHETLLASVMRATLQFFDTTPVGRIIARFSKDMDQMDFELPMNISWAMFSISTVLTSLVVITAITPLFGVMLLPLAVLYYYFLNFYRSSSRELKRLDSTTRSPVYAHFSATLGGLPTIRAFGVDNRFRLINESVVNRNHRAHFMLKMGDRWLALRLEFLGNLIIFGSAAFSIRQRGELYAGLAGVSLIYAMAVTGLLGWTVRAFAQLENSFNSVERVLFYSENIDQERDRFRPENDGPMDLKGVVPSMVTPEVVAKQEAFARGEGLDDDKIKAMQHWPAEGEVNVQHLDMRYREDLELVIKDVSLRIRPGEKIGVVGRTGAGKSTFMAAFLRLVEAWEGKVEIDGVNIATLGLKKLRSKLSIIPQNAVLFSGTVRFNIDPEGTCSDEELWSALDKIGMRQLIEGMDGKLDAPVAEYGENFSAGQRQLLCLDRALVRESKVLLLDEATSSVDFETDQLVQKLIRKEFKDKTVITIAHRLNTIIDSDRILVLDKGSVAEFDHPGVLLSKPDSIFSGMVDQTGAASAPQLRRIAARNYAKLTNDRSNDGEEQEEAKDNASEEQ
eukprot:TRINITY_DN67532_c5_g1_i1.p1 TRINITY_DN67532_c5_g1~~TRINITY_DN67532_c5_g1_i1.p1  ORF type:complete len:1552 (+),score=907.50 TRINITY_DN67532_c5_g1_i1:416-4657(+)